MSTEVESSVQESVAAIEQLLAPIEPFAFGVVVFSQSGASSATPFRFQRLVRCSQDQLNALSKLLGDVDSWGIDARVKGSFVQSIRRDVFGTDATLHATSILAPFDRSIGGVWAIFPQSQRELARDSLNSASRLVGAKEFARKSKNAISVLAGVKWWQVGTVQDLAQTVATRLKCAVGCSDVIIWEVNPSGRALKVIYSTWTKHSAEMLVGQGLAGTCCQDSAIIKIEDLSDIGSIRATGARGIFHPEMVNEAGWKTGLFMPFDMGANSVGVLGIYGPRPYGINSLDLDITSAFVGEFCASYPHLKHVDHISAKQQQISDLSPLINQVKVSVESIHDVQDHLRGALSALHKLQRDYPEAKQLASSAETNVKAIKGLISDLRLSIARARPTPFQLKRTDLVDFLKHFTKIIEHQAISNHIDIETNFNVASAYCAIDHSLMLRVFTNLFDNSKYFLQTISRRQRVVTITLDVSDGQARVKFRDNGPGIESAVLPHIFDYLTTTRGEEGLGLGLAIASEAIEKHGGKINANSIWGSFAEFTIYLPLSPE